MCSALVRKGCEDSLRPIVQLSGAGLLRPPSGALGVFWLLFFVFLHTGRFPVAVLVPFGEAIAAHV